MTEFYTCSGNDVNAATSRRCRKTFVFRQAFNGPLHQPPSGRKIVRKTLSPDATIRKPRLNGFPLMLVGYMRVSSDSDRQSTNLQRDALLAVGVDARHLFEDHASGAKDDRAGPGAGARIRSPWRRVGRVEARPARPFVVALARHRDLAQEKAGGVPLADGEPGYHDALGRVSVPGVRRARAVRTRLDPGTCRRRSGCRPANAAGSAAGRRRSPARSWRPSSLRSMAACPRRRCAATSASSEPR
ncbi:DNA-invertase (plasmid) [Pseudomonas aeruginosa]|nr:DNA-invertase [Pseudomonas aeruginosa]